MKKYLLIVIFIGTSVFLFGQDLQMSTPEGVPVGSGDTIICSGADTSDVITGHMYLINISAQSQSVYAKKSYVYIVPGTINAFCWAGSCYTSFVSPNDEVLAPGDTAKDFSTEFMPQGFSGVSIIRYTFFGSHCDSVWFFIKYNVLPTGIGSINATSLVSNPFPNPASDNINYYLNDLQGQMFVGIYDLTGKMVKSVNLNNTGLVQISVSDLKKGVYFAEVRSGSRVIKTNKILVR